MLSLSSVSRSTEYDKILFTKLALPGSCQQAVEKDVEEYSRSERTIVLNYYCCVSLTRSQGYGIIQPGGLNLAVDVGARYSAHKFTAWTVST